MREKIKEIVIVEGRDDERAVKNAVDAEIIVTHGYGISKTTWNLIEKAYLGPGIIVLTDPDFAGEQIRKRIEQRFPDSRHAFLPREEAVKGTDIGVENAKPESILNALSKARCQIKTDNNDLFTIDDLYRFDLAGTELSKYKRDKLGAALGIGYGNTKTFLRRLNNYGITREEFNIHGQTIFTGDDSESKE